MKVLIVDDSTAGLFISLELESYGCEAKLVRTIAAAKFEIAKNQPDFLVTELFLKDENSLDFAEYRHLFPVILANGYKSTLDDEIKNNVDACLEKPFKSLDLIEIVNRLLRRDFQPDF
uniref:Response regulator receiver protein n=1 Tax=Cyanothece sp. (strain PCC 7425 / ATCC 29141) TaxID=395961 RepID=B8HZB2_CYAP4